MGTDLTERHFIKSYTIMQFINSLSRFVDRFDISPLFAMFASLPPQNISEGSTWNHPQNIWQLTYACYKLIKDSHQPFRQSNRYRSLQSFPTLRRSHEEHSIISTDTLQAKYHSLQVLRISFFSLVTRSRHHRHRIIIDYKFRLSSKARSECLILFSVSNKNIFMIRTMSKKKTELRMSMRIEFLGGT